jgi:hypothetical protein
MGAAVGTNEGAEAVAMRKTRRVTALESSVRGRALFGTS